MRFLKTVRESIEAIKSGDSIVVYPEDSRNGYLAELEGFHEGFVTLAEVCKKRGIDLPICVAYYIKSEKTYVFDKPILYSRLVGKTRKEIAEFFCNRCNELGKIPLDTEAVAEALAEKNAK
jgi:1-acyl-sn-glycerol-3-phosphate acyltransferase